MYKFFEEKQNPKNVSPELSSNESNEDLYEFSPIKNDATDEYTQSLFEQLEEGAKWYTDIHDAINSGANLYAKKIDGDFIGCFPIHIAAYNVSCNTGAVSNILETFGDPKKRKEYIYLKNDKGKNAFQILIDSNDEVSIVIGNIFNILSYLSPTEQQEIINALSSKTKKNLDFENIGKLIHKKDTYKGDIYGLEELVDFFKSGHYIEMCQQRKQEESQVITSNHDFKHEKLGSLGSVYNKKFTARVSYKTGTNQELIPELALIPSDWRLQTAVENNNQGDHVIAYVLLLSSLSHCQGEEVKRLPSLIYNLACRALPDDKDVFLEGKKKIKEVLKQQGRMRVEAVNSLRHECNKEEIFLSTLENNLKKVEIESIARYVEDTVDKFIMTINTLEGESFSQERKKGIAQGFILQKMAAIVDEVEYLKEKQYTEFKNILKYFFNKNQTSELKTGGVTDTILKKIAKEILKYDFKKIKIPNCLLGKSQKLTETTLLEFFKSITPLKKYHEGQAIRDIQAEILKLNQPTSDRRTHLGEIGKLCAKLFDYPYVGNPQLDNENVLYQAIPRHFIIINAAFIKLKDIPYQEKEIVYNSFLMQILTLQLWREHFVLYKNQEVRLNVEILKENILNFATLDENYNFTMKPKTDYLFSEKKIMPLGFLIK